VPWVNIIALNLFRDDRTSRKSTRQLLPEDEGIVSRAIDLRVLEMREALAKCTPRHQRILVAFHGEGYSIRDLAEQSCRSVRAVAAELYRARKELRGFMQVPRHVSSGEGVLRMKVQKQPRSEQASAA
jgi:DNA-directed RNA polymerase specialized sigma24 family protein